MGRIRLQRSVSFLLSALLATFILLIVVGWRQNILAPRQNILTPTYTWKVTSTPRTTPSKYGKNPYSNCVKRDHVGFLKVHKAGSTTVSNILQRYVIQHKLNLVLPNKKDEYGFNYLGHGRNFTMQSVIPLPPGEEYHMLCNHVVYNRSMFRKLLPRDTFYFAIVREPEERFISAAFYYGLVDTIKKTVPGANNTNYIFTEWLTDPIKYGVSIETYNHVAYDFGIIPKYFGNISYVEQYIKDLDNDFDVVLLMNYFDESLMLLRRKLCWSMKDMIYLKQNKGRKLTLFALSDSDRKKLMNWQAIDVLIYRHFRSRFWRQVEAEGSGLFLETEYFKSVLRRVSDYCHHGRKRWPSFDVEKSPWSESFTVMKYDCELMLTNQLEFVKSLQKNAWQKYNESLGDDDE